MRAQKTFTFRGIDRRAVQSWHVLLLFYSQMKLFPTPLGYFVIQNFINILFQKLATCFASGDDPRNSIAFIDKVC